MPYGFTGAPATFQRLLDHLIGPEIDPQAFAYLDDIVVVTSTFEEHLQWLKRVLDRIREAELTINPEKSKFCRSQVRYLGFLVQQDGLSVDPEKTMSIVEYPPPRNIKQLRRFIGMASWYRRFIPQCATQLEPLTRLLRKNNSWEWGDSQKAAFESIKECITSPPILACPKFELPFVLQTDASSVGIGAVLTQETEGVEQVIAFASRALSETERKYAATEQKCLAVVWAIKKFRPYLEGYKFRVITDHSSLRWLHNLKNPTGRLARWALELLEYNYTIEHRKGALHHVPDALSRIYEPAREIGAVEEGTYDGETREVGEMYTVEEVDTDEEICALGIGAIAETCAVALTTDNWYNDRVREVGETPRKYPGWKTENERLYFKKPNRVVSQVVEDLNEWKLVVPKESRSRIIREFHNGPQAGHLGVEKTYHRVALRYFWPRMFKDVAEYVRRCDTCQRTKVEQAAPVGLMGQRTTETPWKVVASDIMGPFPKSKNGYEYILVIQDLFTKWIECYPLRKATGKKIREILDEAIVNRWGAPHVLLTDNGTEFINRELKAFAQERGIAHTTVPPYHPQANPVERVNRVIKTMITAFLAENHREWDEHLAEFRFAYNTAYHTSLGTSPAFLNFGREPQPVNAVRDRRETNVAIGEALPLEWRTRMEKVQVLREWVVENLEAAHQKQAHYYNLRRRDRQFGVGELVLKRQHVLSSAAQAISAKLAAKFHGPFTVSRVLSPVVYELQDTNGRAIGKIHVKDLKPYVTCLDP
ncbi:reverse ribonuclease integrase [Lasius niger]|uniref:RNA-directed DNA polymerase n=1 Tax=Lasius niger TaxID=67767 RepID=A0A0J7KP54_LASNI|nr:reverse ribonuclease integrase [Lasius niger]